MPADEAFAPVRDKEIAKLTSRLQNVQEDDLRHKGHHWTAWIEEVVPQLETEEAR